MRFHLLIVLPPLLLLPPPLVPPPLPSCLDGSVYSGTPVQNNLGELLALLSFLMPEIFRSDVIETLLEFLGEGDSSSPPTASASPSFQAMLCRLYRMAVNSGEGGGRGSGDTLCEWARGSCLMLGVDVLVSDVDAVWYSCCLGSWWCLDAKLASIFVLSLFSISGGSRRHVRCTAVRCTATTKATHARIHHQPSIQTVLPVCCLFVSPSQSAPFTNKSVRLPLPGKYVRCSVRLHCSCDGCDYL